MFQPSVSPLAFLVSVPYKDFLDPHVVLIESAVQQTTVDAPSQHGGSVVDFAKLLAAVGQDFQDFLEPSWGHFRFFYGAQAWQGMARADEF